MLMCYSHLSLTKEHFFYCRVTTYKEKSGTGNDIEEMLGNMQNIREKVVSGNFSSGQTSVVGSVFAIAN